ncbi:MAG: hydantoinase B/oxoprolinase family protein [Rhodospirillaceae bacterium]|jgi:N-methylhydantoinase B|nr:hydantoinase B/oxoprolinase family protein [Rhodospirillaceae bacterium]MBT6138820.1 hydantoinase B/oxoprolinase family protein [Rhodospirillaceae bacterium]
MSPDATNNPSGLDAIKLEIIRGALLASQAECEALLERTAMSPVIREKQDYFIGFYDGYGALVTGTKLPLFGDVLRPILERFPRETVEPGDVFWYNDCYFSRGGVSHSPDQVFAKPLFVDGELVAFAQSWAHFRDIGGSHVGSISPEAESIFDEGIIIPPVRLYQRGELNQDLFDVFVRNSRFPEMTRGDTRALTAAVNLGEKRLAELFERFGAERMTTAFERLIDSTGQAVRRRLDEVFDPSRSYSFADRVDGDGQGNGPFTVRMTLSRDGEGFHLDASGSDGQAKGPVNFLMNHVVPNTAFGIYFMAEDPSLLMNEGAITAIGEVKTREGTIVQPKFPAPLGQRSVTLGRVTSTCHGLLALATGGRSVAASSIYSIFLLSGMHPETGKLFLKPGSIAVGQGARYFSDGIDAIYYIAQQNYPVEFIEGEYPVRVRTYTINTDSGGPGRWRGGCGVIREFEVLVDEALLSVRMDNVLNPPWGLNGGQAARGGRIVLNPGGPDERDLPLLKEKIPVKRGDVVRIESVGGGGWGHPYDREPERVRADVLAGLVTPDAALADYGVMLAAERPHDIDVEATESRRADRFETAMFHRGAYFDGDAWVDELSRGGVPVTV